MTQLLPFVSGIVGLVALVCWIMTLIKMFKNMGVLHGILGIICGLYAFIMGFVKMNQPGWNHKTVMMVWLAAVIVGMIINVMYGGAMMSQLQGLEGMATP